MLGDLAAWRECLEHVSRKGAKARSRNAGNAETGGDARRLAKRRGSESGEKKYAIEANPGSRHNG